MTATLALAVAAIFAYQYRDLPILPSQRLQNTSHYNRNTIDAIRRPDSGTATTVVSCNAYTALPRTTSAFLEKLPPELRNRVYHLVLVAGEPINIAKVDINYYTALLKTCHQIRSEASQIFFAENKFCAPFLVNAKVTAVDWLPSIGRKHAGQITALSIVPQTAKDVKKAAQHRQAWQVAVEASGEALVRGIIASGVNTKHIRLTRPVLDSAYLNWTVSVAFMYEMLKLQLQYEMERIP